ncbi:MAG TPA: Wzz/FepE/Etk N-terminal domain-containing protein [Fodinibius sp.]|nr:Wzz/FepE/Etk N-terminal domain-containing protein [Fodinibius sp.]
MDEENPNGDNAVNLAELAGALRAKRWLIAKITCAFVLLGLLVALFSPVEYTSEALLMPEMKSSESSAGDLLKDYGSMLGLGDLGSMSTSKEGTISPEVYPKIVQSLNFQHQLLKHEIYFPDSDTTVSGYTYFEDIREWSLLELLVEYTIKLPGKFTDPAPLPQLPEWLRRQFDEDAVIELSSDELKIIKEMRERIEIELDSGTGVLTVSARMPNPVAAAQLNRKVISMLKDFVKSYSTQKAKEDLAFAKMQHKQAQQRFKEVQGKLVSFLDRNMNLATAKSQAEEQRLQAEFDLAYSMYNSISQQLMEAKMKVQEQTPDFKPLQAVNVPTEKSEPQRILILVLSLLVGLIVSFVYVAGQNVYHNISQEA